MSTAPDPGKSEAAVRRATGKGWSEWLRLLDEAGAASMTHAEIAAWVASSFSLGGWWAQSVTVGYERLRGRREANQQADGFTANISKTFNVSADRLFAAFTEDAARAEWLEPGTLRLRTMHPARSARFDVSQDGTRVEARFSAKGDVKSAVALGHELIDSREHLDAWRSFWTDRLDRLAAVFNRTSGA